MSSKRFLVTASVLAITAGATALSAQSFRGPNEGRMHDWMERGESGERSEGRWRRYWPNIWGRERFRTKEDFEALTRSRFAAMDTNSDGIVDASEAEELITRRNQRRWGRWRSRHRGQRGPRRMLRLFDANNDGKVTKPEAEARVGEMFARMDLNSDGKITDADLPPMIRGRGVLKSNNHIGRHHMRRRGMRFMHRLRRANTNNDDQVTREEVMAAANKRFAHFDRNQDGVIDLSDFQQMKKDMLAYRVKRFFHRYGASAEGKLTLEQYTKIRNKRFASMDRNGDGRISRDERPGRGWGGWWRGHHWRGHGRWRDHDGWEGRGHRGQRGPEGNPGATRGERKL